MFVHEIFWIIWLSFQSPMASCYIFTCLHPFCRFLPPKSEQKSTFYSVSPGVVFKMLLILCSCAHAQRDSSLRCWLLMRSFNTSARRATLSLFSWNRGQRNTWCLWACLSSMRVCSTLIYQLLNEPYLQQITTQSPKHPFQVRELVRKVNWIRHC